MHTSLSVAGHGLNHPTKSNSLRCYLSQVNISMQKKQRYRCIPSNRIFHFRVLKSKSNDKNLWKLERNYYGPSLPFCPFKGTQEFLKNQLFSVSRVLLLCTISKWRRTKYCVPKIVISSHLYLCYTFRSSTVTGKH